MASSSKANYPELCPGGGLILAWQVKGKKVLIVGGGPVAAGESKREWHRDNRIRDRDRESR